MEILIMFGVLCTDVIPKFVCALFSDSTNQSDAPLTIEHTDITDGEIHFFAADNENGQRMEFSGFVGDEYVTWDDLNGNLLVDTGDVFNDASVLRNPVLTDPSDIMSLTEDRVNATLNLVQNPVMSCYTIINSTLTFQHPPTGNCFQFAPDGSLLIVDLLWVPAVPQGRAVAAFGAEVTRSSTRNNSQETAVPRITITADHDTPEYTALQVLHTELKNQSAAPHCYGGLVTIYNVW